MYCPKCGKEIPDNARFCPKCGAQLPTKAPTTTDNSIPNKINATTNKKESKEKSTPIHTVEHKKKMDFTILLFFTGTLLELIGLFAKFVFFPETYHPGSAMSLLIVSVASEGSVTKEKDYYLIGHPTGWIILATIILLLIFLYIKKKRIFFGMLIANIIICLVVFIITANVMTNEGVEKASGYNFLIAGFIFSILYLITFILLNNKTHTKRVQKA